MQKADRILDGDSGRSCRDDQKDAGRNPVVGHNYYCEAMKPGVDSIVFYKKF